MVQYRLEVETVIDFSIFVKKLLLDKHMTLTQLGELLAMDRKEISRYMLRDDKPYFCASFVSIVNSSPALMTPTERHP